MTTMVKTVMNKPHNNVRYTDETLPKQPSECGQQLTVKCMVDMCLLTKSDYD